MPAWTQGRALSGYAPINRRITALTATLLLAGLLPAPTSAVATTAPKAGVSASKPGPHARTRARQKAARRAKALRARERRVLEKRVRRNPSLILNPRVRKQVLRA